MLKTLRSRFSGARSSLPAPLRVLLHPVLLMALALHAVLLFTPLTREKKEQPKKDDKEAVKITQLSKSSPPKLRPQVRRQLPKTNRPQPKSPLPAPSPGAAGGANQKDPFADFPHYSPSTPDCFSRGLGDNCRIANTDINTLANYFKKALPEKNYKIALEEDGGDRKIFRISKGENQGYLSLLKDAPTTVYVLAQQPVKSLKDLKGAVVVPPELYQLISELVPTADPNDPAATNIARRENFAQPDLFYRPSEDPDAVPQGLPNLDGTPGIVPGQTPESLYATIAPQLQGIFEEIAPAGNYGGGSLYRLKKGSTTVFLSLVPARGVSGAIISVWLKDPR